MEPQLTLPIEVNRIIDGDTLDVDITIPAVVRLRDCWAAERNSAEGEQAAAHLRELCQGKRGTLKVPIQPGKGLADLFSFGRLLGWVEVGGVDVSKAQCLAGHATAEKR